MSKINFSNSIFSGSFVSSKDVPSTGLAEFIILGRSNVGKSSLINSLTKKQLARTSSTPGKTETINHFVIDNVISMYDLPGYGYAKFKSKRASWSDFIDEFIHEKGNTLKAFLLLIDIRHNLSEEDAAMINYLNQFNAPLAVIFTKVDKLSASELKNNIVLLSNQIKSIYNNHFEILPFSTKISEHCKNLEKMIGIWAK
jgi:GTP-binding protein